MRLGVLAAQDGARVVAATRDNEAVRFVDLLRIDPTIPRSIEDLLVSEDGLRRASVAFEQGLGRQAFIEGPLLAPVQRPGKVICIGLNYRDHAEESGMPIPEEPVCFSKFSSAITGPEQPIRLPAVAHKVDYEAELVVVIGRRCRSVPEAAAADYVAGYTAGNDVSARDWQIGRPGGQWLLGKTPDTFAPIGPWLVTADEVEDPHNLPIRLRLNGETMQDSNTSEFIFGIPKLISHLSQLMTLQPGDLIFTGTPPGVGAARKPPVFLKPGDVVEVEIESIGVLRNPVEAWQD